MLNVNRISIIINLLILYDWRLKNLKCARLKGTLKHEDMKYENKIFHVHTKSKQADIRPHML